MGDAADYKALYEEALAAAAEMGARMTDPTGPRKLSLILRIVWHELEHLRVDVKELGDAYDKQRARADAAEAALKKLKEAYDQGRAVQENQD